MAHLLDHNAASARRGGQRVGPEGDQVRQTAGLGLFDVRESALLALRATLIFQRHPDQTLIDGKLVFQEGNFQFFCPEMAAQIFEPGMRIPVCLKGGRRVAQRLFNLPEDKIGLVT